MRVALYIENTKVELFKDETIDLKSSVQDVNDITKNTTDFTKNFSVPASNSNNILFKHYYDATIDNTFDARTKIDARIEIDGIVFRYGKVSLLSVSVKNNRPSAYNIVFYGNLVNLKDKVKDDYLSVLDLSAYNHDYTNTSFIQGMYGDLFSGDLVYPLLVKKRYYYNSDTSDHTQTDSISNIASHNGDAQVHGVKHSDLNPSLKIIRIIEAIESYYGIEFSRDFFGRSEFTNIYMWMVAEREEDNTLFTSVIDWDGGDTTYANLTDNTFTFDPYVEAGNIWDSKTFNHYLTITPTTSDEYKIRTYLNGSLFSENTYTGTQTITQVSQQFINVFSNQDYTIYYEIVAPENFVYSASINNIETISTVFGTADDVVTGYITTASANTITGTVNINEKIPKIKVIDFLKGLFQMFKLVVIQKNPNDPIYVNTLKDYYSEGVVYDLTKYIDSSSHNVERGKLLNRIVYQFKEPQTILNIEYENNTGLGYGDEEAILEDENGEPLDGDSLEITLPFEQIVYERLTDQNGGAQTTIQYGAVISDTLEPTNIEPHLHYVDFTNVSSNPVSFINTDNSEYELVYVATPTHTLGFTEPQHALIFAADLNTYTGNLVLNNLYSNWHFDFISSIFNIKRRTFKFKAYNLPYRYLMSLDLNDVIQIKDNFYRINSFNTNLVTGQVDFELINSFDNQLTPFNSNQTIVLASARASQETIYFSNLDENSTVVVTDIGDGTSWISSSVSGNIITLDIDENQTGEERFASVLVYNDGRTKEQEILVRQLAGNITFDNNTITFDNDTITFDSI